MLQRRGRRDSATPFTEEALSREGLPWIAEAGFLVAAATEDIFEDDLMALASILSVLFSGCVSEEQVMDCLEACANSLENDGWDDRLDALAANLPISTRYLALRAAAAALIADAEFSTMSIPDSYQRIAEAVGCSTNEANAALSEVRFIFEFLY